MLALCLALLPAAAVAHPGHSRSSRLLKLDLAAEPPSLGYGLILEPAASDAARQRADTNGDGTVSEPEGAAALQRMTSTLLEHVSLCSGESLQSMKCGKADAAQVTSAMAAGWAEPVGKNLAVAWELRLELAEGARVIRVTDAWTLADVDRTDAELEPPTDARLLAAGLGGGDAKGGVQTQLRWAEDSSENPRQLYMIWEAPPTRWWVLSIVGAVAGAMTAQLVYSRRRQQKRQAASLPPSV